MSTYTATIFFDELPVEVEYYFYPGCPQTRWEPEEPADVEWTKMLLAGGELSDKQVELIETTYGEEYIREALFEDVEEQYRSVKEARADFLYEQWKEERRGVAL